MSDSRRPSLAVCLLALAALLPRATAATPPKTVGFMGVINKSTGARVQGPVAVTLALYAAPATGSPLWSEQQTVDVSNGLFTVALGSVTPFPPSVDFSQAYYVGITVAGDAQELVPRIPLQGVPYAMFAQAVAPNAITDAQVHDVAYGKITGAPASLPPSGTAGGDLTGTFPNPAVAAGAIDNARLALDAASLARVSGGAMSATHTSGEIVDQRQTNATSDKNVAIGQSFTAGATGKLTAVEINFYDLSSGGDAILRLWSGEVLSGPNAANPARVQPITVASGAGWQKFTIPNPLPVVAGQQYTWGLELQSGGILSCFDNSNPYPGGRSQFTANTDETFRTYVQETAVTVPPGTAVGIGTFTPVAALDVAGTVRTTALQLTASPITGGILTSDDAGVGTWQPAPVIPATLPPTGNAGGDLTGTYPNPVLQNRIVTGEVDGTGSLGIVSGTGFTVQRNGRPAGGYHITFNPAFQVAPAVVCNAYATANALSAQYFNLTPNGVDFNITGTGGFTDTRFQFLAIGHR